MRDSWPDPDDAAELFLRLSNGDPLASSEFAEVFLDPLVNFLRSCEPSASEHDCLTAAEDAVLSVLRSPEVYDPSRLELGAFLRMAASADLKNIRNQERRHQQNREDRDCVELPADGGNNPSDDATELPSFDAPALAEVIAAFSDSERQVFELMRDGERRTEVFAAVLGIAELPTDERAREVKRVKEKIMMRLKRAGGKS